METVSENAGFMDLDLLEGAKAAGMDMEVTVDQALNILSVVMIGCADKGDRLPMDVTATTSKYKIHFVITIEDNDDE